MAHGKKYDDAMRTFDREQLYTPAEAVDLAKSTGKKKFDETVELAVRLGVDPRKADQMVRGTVALPSGTGKDVRVAVFANGDAAAEAREAGAPGPRAPPPGGGGGGGGSPFSPGPSPPPPPGVGG